MMRIICPKVMPRTEIDRDVPVFFIAGPVLGGGDWQAEMCRIFHRLIGDKEFYIACPCRWTSDHSLSEHFVPGSTDQFSSQTFWERHWLDRAGKYLGKRGCVLFWLAEESREHPRLDDQPYARDTYSELGEWRGRMMCTLGTRAVVGAEPNFPGLSVIQKNFDSALQLPKFPIYSTMEETAQAAINVALRQQLK